MSLGRSFPPWPRSPDRSTPRPSPATEQPDHLPTPSSDTPPLLTPTALAPPASLANPMADSHPTNPNFAGPRTTNGSSIPTAEDTIAPLSSPPILDGPQSEADNMTASDAGPLRDVDPQIVEALRGKDRIYVLKLGEMLESLLNEERRPRVDLTPVTSYQRLLVHRCSAYYKLTPETDPMSKTIYVSSTSESRMPPLKISELVPAETTAAPAFKIMRRSSIDRRNKPSQHKAASVTTEDADLSDLDPSETGSLGGRSNTTGGSNKKRMTIEEREAAYNEARNRIFMDFEDKEKVKDKDINSSSSSLSVASGSVKNGGSSAGDADSSSSSPATESEWSEPTRRHDPRQNSGYASASSSTRSIRSSAYISTGSGSSRNSRAASPSSFQYPSLYEPVAPSVPLYDPAHQSTPAAPIYQPPHFGYTYTQGQPNTPYVTYPYYPPPYPPFTSPPHPQQNVPDPNMTPNGEPYSSPPHMPYGPPYLWPQQPVQSPQLQPHPVPPQPHPNGPHPMNSPPPGQPPYQQYMPPPHAYPYAMPGYYPTQPGHHVAPPPPPIHPLPPMHAQQLYDSQVPSNGVGNNQVNGFRNGGMHGGSGMPSSTGRPPPRNNYNHPANGNGPKLRHGAVPPVRAPWSYGPGIGSGGMVTTGPQTHDTVGPRLSNSRRQSNLSNSSANGRSASGDDGSSVTSSTSSSSRRAQTVSAGSQHPLPARPDWAVGLKPSHNPRNMPPNTPPRSMSGSSTQSNYSRHTPQLNPPVSLQSTDFPPLTTIQPSERRMPSGAWGNPSSRPNFTQINHNINHDINNRLDDSGFERPPPKSVELYNPKTPKRVPMNAPNIENKDPSCEVDRTQDGVNTLGDQVASLSLGSGAEYSASTSATAPGPLPA